MLQQERTMSKLFAPGDFLLASTRRGFAQKVGNGHAARFEICNRQSSGTQQRCAISSAIALADSTWLLDIRDRRMRIDDVQNDRRWPVLFSSHIFVSG